MKDLFPVFVDEGEIVYQVPPTVVSFLSTFDPKILQDRKRLLLIVRLLDTMKINSHFWGRNAMVKLRTSDNYEEIQNNVPFANTLLSLAPRLVNRIVYSRILSQHYIHQG